VDRKPLSNKPTANFGMAMDKELAEKLTELAHADHRTRNNYINMILQREVIKADQAS